MAKHKFTPEQLRELAKTVTDRERFVYTLYYRRGWKIEDIAARLDVCRRTIGNVLASIREKAGGG